MPTTLNGSPAATAETSRTRFLALVVLAGAVALSSACSSGSSGGGPGAGGPGGGPPPNEPTRPSDPWAAGAGALIAITSPSYVTTSAYVLAGTVSDPAAIATLSVARGDGPPTVVPVAAGAFSLGVTLVPGANGFWVEAAGKDGFGFNAVYDTRRPSSLALIRAAREASAITAEQALEYGVFAAFDDPRLPAAYRGDDSLTDFSPALGEVERKIPSLSPQATAALGPFFVPPFYRGSWWDLRFGSPVAGAAAARKVGALAAGGSGATPCIWGAGDCPFSEDWAFREGSHVKVWYAKADPFAPAKADAILWVVEGATPSATNPPHAPVPSVWRNAWDTLAAIMPRTPLPDDGSTNNGGDARLDIVIVSSDKMDGRTYPRGSQEKETPAWISVRSALYIPLITSAAVHELMHAFQMALPLATGSINDWASLTEGTANWAANAVLPTTQWEHQRNRAYLEAPDRALDSAPASASEADPFNYGTWLFFLYLDRGFGGGEQIIGDIWRAAMEPGKTDVTAIDAAIRARQSTLEEVWPKFALALLNQGKTRSLQTWDRITAGPADFFEKQTADGDTSPTVVTLEPGASDHEWAIPGALPALSSRYAVFDLRSSSVRAFLFVNGLSFRAGTAAPLPGPLGPIATRAVFPPASQDLVRGTKVQAILHDRTGWSDPLDLGAPGARGYEIRCLDDPGDVDALVLVFTYADISSPKRTFAPLGEDSRLVVSNAFCGPVKAAANLTQADATVTYEIKSADYRFERSADRVLPTISPPGWAIYGTSYSLASGTLEYTASGVNGACPVQLSFSGPFSGAEHATTLDVYTWVPSTSLFGHRVFDFQGFTSLRVPLIARGSARSGQQCVNDAYMPVLGFTFPPLYLPGDRTVGVDGEIHRTGADCLGVPCTGTWSVTRVP